MRASELADALGLSRPLLTLWMQGKRVIDDSYVPRIVAAVERYRPPAEDAWFWKHVDVRQPDECWEWQGFRNSRGYGQCRHNKDQRVAHRWAWEITYGPIPRGILVCHHCDNPPCVNPAHLFLGTQRDNVRDMHAKGRDRIVFESDPPQGEKNANAKLTAAKVIAMRAEYAAGGITQKQLAERYGISPALASFVISGRAWKHVTHGRHALDVA